MKIFVKDIGELKEFEKHGDTFKQIRHNADTGWWLYERTNKEHKSKHYEVVKGVKYSNPDGNVVFMYPGDSQWGLYGYTIPDFWWAQKTIDFIMGKKTISAQELFEFKRTLKMPASCLRVSEIRQF